MNQNNKPKTSHTRKASTQSGKNRGAEPPHPKNGAPHDAKYAELGVAGKSSAEDLNEWRKDGERLSQVQQIAIQSTEYRHEAAQSRGKHVSEGEINDTAGAASKPSVTSGSSSKMNEPIIAQAGAQMLANEDELSRADVVSSDVTPVKTAAHDQDTSAEHADFSMMPNVRSVRARERAEFEQR